MLTVPTDRVVATQVDPVARAASTPFGGAWGRHAIIGRQRLWTPIRVLLLMVLVALAAGWLQKSPCQSGNWSLAKPVTNTTTHHKEFVDGKQYILLCYSDVIPLYGGEGLDHGAVPYRDHHVEYPVLTGFFMYGASKLGAAFDDIAGHAGASPEPVQTYYQVTVLMLVLCALVMVWSVAGLSGRRVWDAAMVAVAPLLIVQAFTNWDLFAVALSTAGLLAWSRRRLGLAGILIGLGAAAKLYPLLLLGPLFVLCLRARKMREFGVVLAGAVLGWAVVNLPVAVAWTGGWKTFFANNSDRAADPDTIWNIIQYLSHDTIPVSVLNVVTIVLFAVACAGIGLLALAASRRPRLAQLAFLVVAAFLLINKVWSPQYSLWLIPLAVLARPRWRLFLWWQAVDCLLWFPRMYYLFVASQQQHRAEGLQVLVRGIDEKWFLLVVAARDLLVIAYAVMVIRDVLRPEDDVVRRAGMDDPAGGVLDGAPDGWTIGLAGGAGHSADSGDAGGAGDTGGPDDAGGPGGAADPGDAGGPGGAADPGDAGGRGDAGDGDPTGQSGGGRRPDGRPAPAGR